MKKLFVASVLALAATMACQQKASAWSEFKFSAGVNFGWAGGGNRILWGLYHSAPYPGGQDVYPVFPGIAAGLGYNAANAGYAAPAGFAPHAPTVFYGSEQGPGAAGTAGVAPTAPAATMPAVSGPHQSYNPYYNTGYQPVGYSYPGYSTSQVPSYWYGR